MSFTGTEGSELDIEIAASWTANHRTANPNDVKAHFFGRDIMESILAQSGCVGIRFYHALNDSGEQTLIMVGADSNGDDLVDGVIGEFSKPCPSYCSSTNSLNS